MTPNKSDPRPWKGFSCFMDWQATCKELPQRGKSERKVRVLSLTYPDDLSGPTLPAKVVVLRDSTSSMPPGPSAPCAALL